MTEEKTKGNKPIDLGGQINSPLKYEPNNQPLPEKALKQADKVKKELEDFKKKGARVVVEPVIGFEGRLISFLFLNMKKTNCNLIELAEKK